MTWFGLWIAACTSAPPTVDVTPPPEPPPEVAAAVRPDPASLPRPTDDKLAAHHLVVSWAEAPSALPRVSRSEPDAYALAVELHARATAGEDIGALARAHSDDPSGRRGGDLGVWRTGVMDDAFERCTAAAEVGGIAPLCLTDQGYHVIRRDPVDQAAGVAFAFDASPEASEQAKQRAMRLREALGEGVPVDEIAEQADRQLPLGTVGRGQLLPTLERALFGLSPGAASAPVEHEGTLYVVVRTR